MGRIRVLDEQLASQIAAGEVVERPASVAKELIENAIDAQAGRVEVRLAQGGVERLVVIDDGVGMAPDDATLCFSRHATSKLKTIEDLRAIGTFGFRGEALAAIASVARVRLVTRAPEAAIGFEVRVEGGHIVHVGECAAPRGTRVEVADLFFNVPARRKFLKSARTEAAHVEGVVQAVGLGCPALALHFDGEGRRLLELGAAAVGAALDDPRLLERVARCLGPQLRDQLLPFEASSELLRLRGHLVAPLESRRDTLGIHLSVNGRPVSDRGLVQALRVAYRPLLEVGRHPIAAIDLAIDPSLVDVNVHPRKAEVRFEDPRRVHGHLVRLVSDYLAQAPWRQPVSSRSYRLGAPQAGQAARSGELPLAAPARPHEDPAEAHRARVREALARFQARLAGRPSTRPSLGGSAPATGDGLAVMQRLGAVADGAFLLLDDTEGLVVVDREAASQRIAFARLQRSLAAGPIEGQPMLFPLRVELSPLEAEVLEDRGAALVRLGLDLELFGEGVGLCRAVPPFLDGGRCEEITRAALEAVSELPAAVALDVAGPQFADALCRRLARFAGGDDDDDALLRSLDALEPFAAGPLGPPAARRLSPDDLSRLFVTGGAG